MSEQIVGRDPLEKTMVETFIAAHPDDSDEQIAERFRRSYRSLGADPDTCPVTAEVVAKWRSR